MTALRAPIDRMEGDMKDPEKAMKLANVKAARDVAAVEAARQLMALFQDIGERRDVFVAEDGAVVILELLEGNMVDTVLQATLKPLHVSTSLWPAQLTMHFWTALSSSQLQTGTSAV